MVLLYGWILRGKNEVNPAFRLATRAGVIYNNNNYNTKKKFYWQQCLLLKSYLQVIRLKKKKLFIQNTIYNSCRFKKHLI